MPESCRLAGAAVVLRELNYNTCRFWKYCFVRPLDVLDSKQFWLRTMSQDWQAERPSCALQEGIQTRGALGVQIHCRPAKSNKCRGTKHATPCVDKGLVDLIFAPFQRSAAGWTSG